VSALNIPLWYDFLGRMFRREFDLSNLYVPQKPAYQCRPLINPLGITNNQVFEVCTKRFHGKTWRYINDLGTVHDIVERPDRPYVIWVRDTVEADEEMQGKSAEDIAKEKINTETLFERQLHELKFFDEIAEHLDIKNLTLCAGSRSAGGSVPSCYWFGVEFYVSATYVAGAGPALRARVVVS